MRTPCALTLPHGQQFENVKHLTWFLDAVATELLRRDEQEIAIHGKKAT